MSELAKRWREGRSLSMYSTIAEFHNDRAAMGDAMADEIECLEKEQSDILHIIQTRLQPPGSPCPGSLTMLVTWIADETVKRIERLEKENAELKARSAKYEGGPK